MRDELSKIRDVASMKNLPPPPASNQEMNTFENKARLRLPPFLRDIYLRVANGGLGPGYGLMPLVGGPRDDPEETVLGLYLAFLQPDDEDTGWAWPASLLPICDWGCAIRSCVDCSTESGRVVRFDPNGHGPGVPWDSAFVEERPSTLSWLMDWASGTLRFDL